MHHERLRLAVFVTALRPWTSLLWDWQLHALFYLFLACNVLTGGLVPLMQRRICFYTGPEPPTFVKRGPEDDVLFVPLMESNLHQVRDGEREREVGCRLHSWRASSSVTGDEHARTHQVPACCVEGRCDGGASEGDGP